MNHVNHLRCLNQKQTKDCKPYLAFSRHRNSLFFRNPPILQSQSHQSNSPGCHATYQTNPNPLQHSNSFRLRLTLVTLSILRAPLMVRTAITALVLAAFVVSAAGAVRVATPAKLPPRPASGKSTVHSSHHASHAVPRHASRSAHRSATHVLHPAKKTSTVKHTNAGRSYISARSLGLKTTPGTSAQPRRSPEPPAALPATPAVEPSRETTVAVASAPEVVPQAQFESGIAPSVATTKPFNEPIDVERLFESASSSVASNDKLGRYALRGSRDSLIRQNERSEADSLERIEDDADLADRIARGMLVPVPEVACPRR